jgi:phosphatidylglycerophosphate synthase
MNIITNWVKSVMMVIAKVLNKVTAGYIRPGHVTVLSLAGHGLVVWALVSDHPIKAAVLILVFGLMDSLDGALARVQHRTSLQGMFFDAVSDRVKEVLIYSGLAAFLSHQGESDLMWLVAAVAGSSLLVSYVKAKGEMAFAGSDLDPQKLNRLFSDGLGRYEIRMFILIAGLSFDTVEIALLALFVLNALTAAQRFIKVSGALKHVKS